MTAIPPGILVNLRQLEAELIAASVDINSLGTRGDPPSDIYTYDDDGAMIDLPPAGIAVLAAHVPSVTIIYAGEQTMTNRITTSGLTPVELFRATLRPLTAYTALVDLVGVDSGNGVVRVIRASIAAKRLGNGALLVGTSAVIANHSDALATAWTVTPSVSGNDFVITCTGAAGRSVDWFLRLRVDSFTPGGQS